METKIKKEVISEAELRSSGVQNLLNKHPYWLILKGNFLISLVLIIFLVFIGYSVKYPEFIKSKIKITSQNVQNNSIKSKQSITGLLAVPKRDVKKIIVGQKVIIKLYDFPYPEFGILEGQVRNISFTPGEKENFYVHVTFPEGLKTSYNKNIPSDKELMGSAEIVVQEMNVIEKFISQINSKKIF